VLKSRPSPTALCRTMALVFSFLFPQIATASSSIVISQIYGGGGNSGSTLRNDFVELFNRSNAAVSVSGWTIQYASSTGSTWDRINLTGSIEPGHYYLVALAAGTGGTVSLPTADATGSISLSATTGKVALVSNSTLLSGSCPTTAIVDFVGYGSANCSEGSPAPALTNTTALIRTNNGCGDTDNNAADFAATSPAPRNTATAANLCGGTPPGGGSGPGPTTGGSGTVPKPTIGGAPVIFPHFAQGGGYQTTFTFNNLTNTAATITVNFYSQSGTVIDSNTLGITGFGSVRTAMSGSTLSVGWAQASVNPPVDLVGTETIQLFNSSGALVMEASVLGAQPDTTLRMPVLEKDGFGTGVALVNLGTAASTVTLTLRSTNGAAFSSSAISLEPLQQTARFASELFTGLNNFEGMLEVTAPRSLAALALRQNFASGIFSTLLVSPTPTEMFFSPNVGTASRIVQEINQALSTIDIAIYSFTRDEIADALIAAKNRGVQIRILADSSQASGTGSDIARLEAAGFQLKRTSGGGGGILHDKFAIFDKRLLLTGSYNWSTNAEENDENAVFIRNTSVIEAFQTNFNLMWSTR